MNDVLPGIDLTSRHPELHPESLTAALTPGHRFEAARFSTFQPNPAFPSQAVAQGRLEAFVAELGAVPRRGGLAGLFGGRKPREGTGLYLDGGFGVGKTHLLASAWHAAPPGSRFLSFQDLMYAIGALGMPKATAAFAGTPLLCPLLCIDEFELDDPGNTHMANTFLAAVMPAGTSVIATSNTEPGALGQGRFNAGDFQRQIQGISGRFEALRLDGPDYRQRGSTPADTLTDTEYAAWQARQTSATLAELDVPALNRVLLGVHPARFALLLEGVAAVGLRGLTPMTDQNAALRFVHFVDKVYDLGLHAAFTGAPLGTLFHETYRHGAYAKKYARCLSRLSELLGEARAVDVGR